MHISLVDTDGRTLNSFEDDAEAFATLRQMVDDDPSSADSLLLLRYDDDGNPVGEGLMVDDLPPPVFVAEPGITGPVVVFIARTCANGWAVEGERWIAPGLREHQPA